MMMTASTTLNAERAFAHAFRSRRRSALARRLRREPRTSGHLKVYDERTLARRARPGRGVREIPLSAIRGTMEPGRAHLFDRGFRPAAPTRRRWERVWAAVDRGHILPPISVVPVQDGYVVRDGHHRVSVAKARGAVTIDAALETGGASL
jgi:hypothetical protein